MSPRFLTGQTFNLVRSPYSYWTDKFQAYVKEKHPDAVFVEEICLNAKGGYTDWPGVVLYQENPPEPYKDQFFAYFLRRDMAALLDGRKGDDQWVICGQPTFSPVVDALFNRKNNTLIFSRFRHDFFEHGGVFVDGGRDYMRYGGSDMKETVVVKLNLLTKEFELDGVVCKCH